MRRVDVAVVGGGSTGCSVLYHLAKRGAKGCLLVEMGPHAGGGGQTSRSMAIVRTHYSSELLVRMALNSYRFFRNFERELPGLRAGYVETGLLVGADESSTPALVENLSMYRRMGIDSRLVEGDGLGRMEPALEPRAFSAVAYEPNAGYAEPSTTAASFASAARALGAEVLTGTRVVEISRTPDGYVLSTSEGVAVACRRVVVATGVWSRPLLGRLGVDLPIRVARHPVAVFGRPPEYQGTRPLVFDLPRHACYKPEGGRMLFVASIAPQLDSLSAPDADPEHYDQGVSYDEVEGFAAAAAEALPAMGKGVYERGYSGLYDNTPDQQPIIDELSGRGYPGLFCLVGLSGHGFKLAPEFGRIMASLVLDGKFPDYDISPFRLDRFQQGNPIRGRYPVSTVG